jgi:hypothetical protein
MPMNPSTLSAILRETEQGKEHRGNPGVDTLPQEPCPTEQPPPRNSAAPDAPDEGTFETYTDGSGI